jgi:hypothetical protein
MDEYEAIPRKFDAAVMPGGNASIVWDLDRQQPTPVLIGNYKSVASISHERTRVLALGVVKPSLVNNRLSGSQSMFPRIAL